MKKLIENIFIDSNKTYGSPRVHAKLISKGHNICENTVAKYMKEMELDARLKKKFRVMTTDSNHNSPIADRLFKFEEELPKSPGKLLAGDITYIRVGAKFYYLSVVIDLFNREVVGWSLDNNLQVQGVMNALNDAIGRSHIDAEVIFHSDRGSQYASEAYRNLLKNNNLKPSMSRRGNCYDNCYVESFFKTLKNECIYRNKIENENDLKKLLFNYIEIWYNKKRMHSSLGFLSPKEYVTKYQSAS